MHQDGTGGSAIGRADEALGDDQAVVVGDKGQPGDVAGGSPGRVAAEDEVAERDISVTSRWGLGSGVVPSNGPLREVLREEVDKMSLHFLGPGGARHAGDEDWGQEGALVDVEVGTGGRDVFEACVREFAVCRD